MDIIESIEAWHKEARPNPALTDSTIQFACHLEEIVEMMDAMYLSHRGSYARLALHEWSQALKKREDTVLLKDREGFIDAICDQIVTGVGVAWCEQMNAPEALKRVNKSNYTKMVDGKFIRNEQGKITKPSTYEKPNLEGCY